MSVSQRQDIHQCLEVRRHARGYGCVNREAEVMLRHYLCFTTAFFSATTIFFWHFNADEGDGTISIGNADYQNASCEKMIYYFFEFKY